MRNADCEKKSAIAFLWDESFLWGLMACKALKSAGLPFELVRAEDVKKGCLDRHAALFVPGGWASNKMKALGEDGAAAIRHFVENGGAYIGLCGGAGLATLDGIGLVPVKRRPTKDRVPSFSGRIRLTTSDHPLWRDIEDPVFHAWWPSQFVVDGPVRVLASYAEALPDSFSSDVNVGDASEVGKWQELEELYGINLDPKRLINEPAVLEGRFGKGRVILSLVHFDTPEDRNGALVLKNIWKSIGCAHQEIDHIVPAGETPQQNHEATDPRLRELADAVNGLIDLGYRNFLWFRRGPMLLQWRRGVRGLEYCTLSVLIKEIVFLFKGLQVGSSTSGLDQGIERIRHQLLPFVKKASRLLVLERIALQNGHITYEQCDDPVIKAMRDELFSRAKSHGGLFKELLDDVDRALYVVMTEHAGATG